VSKTKLVSSVHVHSVVCDSSCESSMRRWIWNDTKELHVITWRMCVCVKEKHINSSQTIENKEVDNDIVIIKMCCQK
jgi:hypothetical protein